MLSAHQADGNRAADSASLEMTKARTPLPDTGANHLHYIYMLLGFGFVSLSGTFCSIPSAPPLTARLIFTGQERRSVMLPHIQNPEQKGTGADRQQTETLTPNSSGHSLKKKIIILMREHNCSHVHNPPESI